MKKLLPLFFIGLLPALHVVSQVPKQRRGAPEGKLYGKVIDSASNHGIDAASVQLFRLSNDSLVGGMLTRPNGDFDISHLPVTDKYYLVVTAIGFGQKKISVAFNRRQGNNMMAGLQKDLGNIRLRTDAKYLNTVTVLGQKPALQMGIDRKTFDVSKSIVSSGGTAIDVMRNIPSVSVDVDGNVTLRNSTPQIFVDGRPTILTLDQIPADNIERIELITNPSAKFDASSVGGIINVVLKKDKKLGLNGLVSAGIGSPDVLNGNLAVNLRQGKFNFFVNGNYHKSGGTSKGSTYRINKNNGTIENYFNQQSLNKRNRRFTSVRFGIDYYLDNRNTLSVIQHFVQGRFSSDEHQNQEYQDINKQTTRLGERYSDGSFHFDRSSTRLSYKHNFVETGKNITADVTYNRGNGGNNSNILNYYYNPDGSPSSSPNQVKNNGSNNNNQVTIQADFVDPNGDDSKLETGVRTYINNFTSLFDAFSVSNGGETKLPLSNNYKYREMVNAAYVTYTGKVLGLGYQAGLRVEHSKFDGELIDSARKFGYQYPKAFNNLFDALFPSLYISKEIKDGVEVQLNYSRRIRRPNFWQLNPFVDINDPLNIRQGNPALKPEFTNSLEFNYNLTYNTGNFLGVIYYRNTTGDITRYSDTISAAQYQQLNNAAVDPGAILNTFINAHSQNRLGLELTLQQKIGNNFDFTPNIELQYRKVNADVNNIDLTNEGFSWEAKLITNYRITSVSPVFNKLSFQLTGEYESPEVRAQGKRKERYVADFGLRKDFLKNNKLTLSFNIRDIFNTRRWGSIYDTPEFYQDSYRRWDVRSFRVSLSYKFGDANFSLFRRGNNRSDRGNEEGGEEGQYNGGGQQQ